MKKKYAFLFMDKDVDANKQQSKFETEHMISYIFTVKNMEAAVQCAVSSMNAGVGAIELCGAFGEAGAEKIIHATENKVAVGYVVHKSEQDELFEKFYGG